MGQYWGNITSDGVVSIPRVKAGTYRLTMYADGVFGQFEQDGVVVSAGDGQGSPLALTWNGEAHGKELWRIGTPDKVGCAASPLKGTVHADVSLNCCPDRGGVQTRLYSGCQSHLASERVSTVLGGLRFPYRFPERSQLYYWRIG